MQIVTALVGRLATGTAPIAYLAVIGIALCAGDPVIAQGVQRPAVAQPSPVLARALDLQAHGRAGDAYALLVPEADSRAGDPEFDYVLGLAAADSGHAGEAIAAFQRVLAVRPNHAQARAEIARLYAQAGDIDTARAEFDTVVQDPSLPDPVRQRVGRLIRDYDRTIRGGGDRVTGFADAEIGHDGNVNTATALTSITLPVFAFLGPATLGGAATRMNDQFYQVQGGISGSTALGRQDRAFLSALGSWRDNFSSDRFDQAALTATAGAAHTGADGGTVSLSGQVQRFWLGRNGFRTGIGAVGQYTGRLAGDRALSAQLHYFRFNYDDDPLRDSNRVAGTISYADRTSLVSVGGGREATVRSRARNLGYWFGAVQAGGAYPFAPRLAILAGASAEHRDYDSRDPLFLVSRRDTQLDATLGLRVALGNGIGLRPRATLTRNFSNLGLYDYTRVTGSVGLRFEF